VTTIEVVQTVDGVFFDHGDHMQPVVCHWFAKCVNQAVTTMSHPTLGDVPICTRCKDKMEAL
jgi:hypothetical protein